MVLSYFNLSFFVCLFLLLSYSKTSKYMEFYSLIRVGKAYAITREVNLLAQSIWNQGSTWFNGSRHQFILWKHSPPPKKKVKANERSISLCFYHQNGFIFDVSLSHRHSLLISVHSPTPSPSPTQQTTISLYTIHWIHMCHITTLQERGTRQIIRTTYLPVSLWHLFLFSSSL